jgi:hypothetical protein
MRWNGSAVALLMSVFFTAGGVRAQLTCDDVLDELGCSAANKKRVLDGDLLTTKVGAVSERDLAGGARALQDDAQ